MMALINLKKMKTTMKMMSFREMYQTFNKKKKEMKKMKSSQMIMRTLKIQRIIMISSKILIWIWMPII